MKTQSGRIIVRYHSLLSWAFVTLAISLGITSGFQLFGESRDYLNYLVGYKNLRLTDTLDNVRFEPGYMLAAWTAKFLLGLGFEAFSAILVSGGLLIKFQLFRNFQRPILTTIFYLCCWYPVHEYTQIRTALAISLSLLAANFIFQGRLVAFAIAMSLAVTFHSTALLIAMAITTVYLKRFRLPLVIVAIALVALVGESLSSFVYSASLELNPLVEVYVTFQDQDTVRILSGSNLLAVAFLASVLLSRSLKTRKDECFFILASFGLVAAVALQTFPIFSYRIKEIFLVFLVPLAFNAPLTKRTLPQYTTAAALAAWSLYSAISQGII
jgi:hypothetical protein